MAYNGFQEFLQRLEQAGELNTATNGILQGHVSVVQSRGKFELELSIIAPMVDNYEYLVLVAKHSLDLYPVTVTPGWDRNGIEKKAVLCANQEEFENAVGDILSSERVRRAVTSLLAQSKA